MFAKATTAAWGAEKGLVRGAGWPAGFGGHFSIFWSAKKDDWEVGGGFKVDMYKSLRLGRGEDALAVPVRLRETLFGLHLNHVVCV